MAAKKGASQKSRGSQTGGTRPSAADIKAIELIRESGVLNPSSTLDRIMEVTKQLAVIEPPTAEAHTDTFIHKHFIYKHTE